jgi:polyisoprenoid-binding protein YceI
MSLSTNHWGYGDPVMRTRWLTASAMGVLVGGTSLGAQTALLLVQHKYEVDPQHSAVEFVARILRVVKVPGRFRDYSATIIYDPAHPEQSSVAAIIVAKSIDTDMAFRDTHLRSPDFIDASRYPLLVFQSDSVRARAGGLTILGRLTLHGVTRLIAVPFTIVLPPENGSSQSTRTRDPTRHPWRRGWTATDRCSRTWVG